MKQHGAFQIMRQFSKVGREQGREMGGKKPGMY